MRGHLHPARHLAHLSSRQRPPGFVGRPVLVGGPPGRPACGEPPGAGTLAGGPASAPERPPPPAAAAAAPPRAAAACAGRLANASGPRLSASVTRSSAFADAWPCATSSVSTAIATLRRSRGALSAIAFNAASLTPASTASAPTERLEAASG